MMGINNVQNGAVHNVAVANVAVPNVGAVPNDGAVHNDDNTVQTCNNTEQGIPELDALLSHDLPVPDFKSGTDLTAWLSLYNPVMFPPAGVNEPTGVNDPTPIGIYPMSLQPVSGQPISAQPSVPSDSHCCSMCPANTWPVSQLPSAPPVKYEPVSQPIKYQPISQPVSAQPISAQPISTAMSYSWQPVKCEPVNFITVDDNFIKWYSNKLGVSSRDAFSKLYRMTQRQLRPLYSEYIAK